MRTIRSAAVIASAVILCFVLNACTRTVRDSADELCLYRWESRLSNGNTVELSFDGDRAALTVQNDSFSLIISGIAVIGEDAFVISDEETLMNYSFPYLLHGDCVELSYGGGTITLEKIVL